MALSAFRHCHRRGFPSILSFRLRLGSSSTPEVLKRLPWRDAGRGTEVLPLPARTLGLPIPLSLADRPLFSLVAEPLLTPPCQRKAAHCGAAQRLPSGDKMAPSEVSCFCSLTASQQPRRRERSWISPHVAYLILKYIYIYIYITQVGEIAPRHWGLHGMKSVGNGAL